MLRHRSNGGSAAIYKQQRLTLTRPPAKEALALTAVPPAPASAASTSYRRVPRKAAAREVVPTKPSRAGEVRCGKVAGWEQRREVRGGEGERAGGEKIVNTF